jgi:hypothetical protein
VTITISTAPSIPIVSALGGGAVEDLDRERGEFLKSRTGLEVALLYLSTLFTSALLPYSLAHLYIARSRWRHIATFIFLAFAVSFLVKALFVTVAAPLVYVLLQTRRGGSAKVVALVCAALVLLFGITRLAFGDSEQFEDNRTAVEQTSAAPDGDDHFFSTKYRPVSTADFLVWRTLAIPMLTAADTLLVFDQEFRNEPLAGATSSLLAALLGMERVPLEQIVYAHQFGWNDLANANAFYVTDIYANFGWPGLIVSSLLVGQALRWFSKSADEALRGQWLLFTYMLFAGSIFGVLLSNGYMLILLLLLFAQVGSAIAYSEADKRSLRDARFS